MARVVVVGDLMTDTVAHAALPLAKGSDTPATVSMHGGGSGANIAAWLAADGGEVAFVGRRGADIAGRNRDMELMGYGVDARLVMDPDRPTGTCVVMVTHKGDHTMMSDPGANAALHPDDLPKDLFAPGAHLHMSGYTMLNEGSRAAALAAFGHAGRAGMTISVDGASSAPLERVGAEPFLEMTNGVTLLIVNADQAAVLTGREDPESAAHVLTAWYPEVVVKLGRRRGAVRERPSRPGPVPRPARRDVRGRDRGRGRLLRRFPPRLAGQEAAARGAGQWLPSGRERTRTGRCPACSLSRASGPPSWTGSFRLDGRVALVTGGSSGIGHAMARALALAGARVVILARGKDGLGEAVAAIQSAGGTAAWVQADLADPAAAQRAAEETVAIYGEPDILVNAAGANPRPPLGEQTLEQWAEVMAVNLTAPFVLGQRFGPAMARRGWGRIINVASQQAVRAFGNSGGYGASKAGLAGLTRSQSEAWAGSGVCCNAITPGFVATPLTEAVASDPVRSAALAARTMVGRNGEPADFEGVAVFLASRASGYVTGQLIFVDGGFSVT